MPTTKEFVVGTFTHERDTKNTHVYTRDVNGRNEAQYVQKSVFDGTERPTTITVVIRPS